MRLRGFVQRQRLFPVPSKIAWFGRDNIFILATSFLSMGTIRSFEKLRSCKDKIFVLGERRDCSVQACEMEFQ